MTIFQQIPVGGDNNLAYLIADEKSKEAAVVDPSFNPEKILNTIKELSLKLKYLINTHSHHDHINGNDYILQHSNAKHVKPQDGDILYLGALELKIIATPGHTPDSICILVENKLLTGDTLFVGKIGRTWSPIDTKTELGSIHNKILTLKDDIEVYPGHDYGATPISSILNEKQNNPYL